MKIKDLPMIERPREKLVRYGSDKLNNSELLAIILSSGIKGENAIELAKKILKKFSKDKLAFVCFNDLKKIAGLGITKITRILACLELGRRLFKDKKTLLLMSPQEVWQALSDISDKKKEHFVAFFLDIKNQVIKREIISIGTLNLSLIHPREVFEPAIRNFSAQIILAHNHPSDDPQPSSDDIKLTEQLIEAGKILGIEIIDHVIVTKNNFKSFKEDNLIK